jgi:hypothetical protein
MSAVADGIKRRRDGVDDEFRDGTFYWLEDILAANGLPAQDSHIGVIRPQRSGPT